MFPQTVIIGTNIINIVIVLLIDNLAHQVLFCFLITEKYSYWFEKCHRVEKQETQNIGFLVFGLL